MYYLQVFLSPCGSDFIVGWFQVYKSLDLPSLCCTLTMPKSVASDARSSSSCLPARASATLKTVKNATKRATAVVSKTIKQAVNVARPSRKRRRTSKADAALEKGDDEIGFLADSTPPIPGVFLDLNLFLFLNFVEGEKDVSNDGA
jgi:hypothetical protein